MRDSTLFHSILNQKSYLSFIQCYAHRRYAADELRRLAAASYCFDLPALPVVRSDARLEFDYAAEREPKCVCEYDNELNGLA